MFSRFFSWVKKEFELSYNETKDILWFAGILSFFAITFTLIPILLETNFSQVVWQAYQEKASEVHRTTTQRKEKEPIFKKQKSLNLRAFNPNTCSEKELLEMGIQKRVVTNLIKFRNKGMVFRTLEDVGKVYGVKEDLLTQLTPYLQFPERVQKRPKVPYESKPAKEKIKQLEKNKYVYRRPTAFDINTADVQKLSSIKGIGEVFARRIIKYREALGGFYSIKQVKSTYGLPPEAYDSLAVVAILEKQVKKIKINKIEIGTFSHPYLKKYQIKGIVNYRKQHGNFNNSDDLEKLRVLDKETLVKLIPYISYDK